MSMGGTGSGNGMMADINVTPLVDVMLVLLIIFMVTAPMMMQGVDVALPQTTSAPLSSEKEHFVITIDANNQIFINEFQVPMELFRDKLARLVENQPGREVYLRADKNIPYGVVVQVMAEIKAAGIDKLGMVTVPQDGKPEGKKKK
ncbi:protein TolR [Desulfatirhabdium butyrativorans]|uniref:protein TolR n=1 Tax=Desulfatirhabdium butyrativorans TaxID=340467 RepID=UPI0004232684|nr:protein TolR [Desulfatirhabdium butyrativorans]